MQSSQPAQPTQEAHWQPSKKDRRARPANHPAHPHTSFPKLILSFTRSIPEGYAKGFSFFSPTGLRRASLGVLRVAGGRRNARDQCRSRPPAGYGTISGRNGYRNGNRNYEKWAVADELETGPKNRTIKNPQFLKIPEAVLKTCRKEIILAGLGNRPFRQPS